MAAVKPHLDNDPTIRRWSVDTADPNKVLTVEGESVSRENVEELSAGESRTFEIGGTEVVTYADLIREYARQKGLRRWLIFVPVLTPYLSGLWLALVTPAAYEVGRHLIEG